VDDGGIDIIQALGVIFAKGEGVLYAQIIFLNGFNCFDEFFPGDVWPGPLDTLHQSSGIEVSLPG